jgi:DNA-binding HxlR family transcriptional regulator
VTERRVLKDSAPGHVEYDLTALGKTLEHPLTATCDSAADHHLHNGDGIRLTGRLGTERIQECLNNRQCDAVTRPII